MHIIRFRNSFSGQLVTLPFFKLQISINRHSRTQTIINTYSHVLVCLVCLRSRQAHLIAKIAHFEFALKQKCEWARPSVPHVCVCGDWFVSFHWIGRRPLSRTDPKQITQAEDVEHGSNDKHPDEETYSAHSLWPNYLFFVFLLVHICCVIKHWVLFVVFAISVLTFVNTEKRKYRRRNCT